MPTLQSDIERIEALVRDRLEAEAIPAIHALQRSQPGDEDLLIQCCDWLRRLGRFKEGFRLLNLRRGIRGRRLLWGARLLNLLGASSFARQFIRDVEPTTAMECRVMGNILLSNFEHGAALACFEKMRAFAPDLRAYEERLGLLGLADSLAGLRRFDEASALAEELSRTAKEPIFQAITLQAVGEYRCRAGDPRGAIGALRKAFERMPASERSHDRAFLLKWLGFATFHQGASSRSEGLGLLDESIALLRGLNAREETWLDALRLKAVLGVLEARELALLYRYPGMAEGLKAQLPPCELASEPRRRAQLEIWPVSSEHRFRERNRPTLPIELQLLGYASLTQHHGLSLVRAKSLLWIEEGFSYFALDDRVHQLLLRARTEYEIPCRIERGKIRLTAAARARIQVHDDSDERPRLLRLREKILRGELETFYGLAGRRGQHYVAEWESKGWIRREGRRGFSVAS
jgi:tetratricopeptide (TPR) repeat protein